MRYPQIVVFEPDGLLARTLEPIVSAQHRWLLRESRQAPACLELLRSGGPTVLVLRLGRNLVRELTFLDQVHGGLPDLPVVVVGDAEDATLMAIALELGASHVVQPPQPRQALQAVVESLMLQTVQRWLPESAGSPVPVASLVEAADAENPV